VPAPLLVVDAPSLLYRAWFALPDSIRGAEGMPVNALLGSTNAILRVVADRAPRAVVICSGAEAARYRVERFAGYHADRPPVPEGLAWQIAQSPRLFEALGWTLAATPELEADDLLHSFALTEVEAGGSALLMTGDRDMFQCANDRVKILYVRTGGKQGAELVDAAEVKRRYGVPPELVPDFIALRGDPSDGIPGAKGIGEKGAAELLQRHGSLEAALEHGVRETKKTVRAALCTQADELRAFKEIATLQEVDVELPADRSTDYAGAAKAARERGMERLAKRLEQFA
jgi:5'-3' exonuclease